MHLFRNLTVRGGNDDNNDGGDDDNDNNRSTNNNDEQNVPLTNEEIRAKRLAKISLGNGSSGSGSKATTTDILNQAQNNHGDYNFNTKSDGEDSKKRNSSACSNKEMVNKNCFKSTEASRNSSMAMKDEIQTPPSPPCPQTTKKIKS